jgi:hypothetical protein
MAEIPPHVAIGEGERAPWADLDLTCPRCGGECELKDSDPPGLPFISCCGQSWLRGQPDFKRLFGSNAEDA